MNKRKKQMDPSNLSIFIVFLAGIVTILKPCCLPLVPVIFSGSGGHRLRPLAIVSGLTVSFTTMGVLVSAFGATFGAYTDYLRNIAILFIMTMGLVLFDEDVNMEFMKISGRITQSLQKYRKEASPEDFFWACHLVFCGSHALVRSWALCLL
jgi:cytochrome c biogenesis protein CcdA